MINASAYIIGPPDGPGELLYDVAREMGFARVMPYGGVTAAEAQVVQTPLCFFLCAPTHDVRSLSATAEAIRFSAVRALRFSPIVYFSESPSLETIRQCVSMGFDDVVTLPFTQNRVAERLLRQVGETKVFYETSGYFGPDRRGRGPAAVRPAEQRGGGHFRRLEIVRNADSGINVLRDDFHQGAGIPGFATFQ